jgi:hypothetical protein
MCGIGSYLRWCPAAAGVPVLLRPGRVRVCAEAAQLGPLAQAPLELGEAGEARQAGHVVPEPEGVFWSREPADHRAEEGRASRGAELDDRGADVPAGRRQWLVAFGADLLVPPRVVQRVRQPGGQAGLGEQRLDEGPAAADRRCEVGRAGGVEDLAAEGLASRAGRRRPGRARPALAGVLLQPAAAAQLAQAGKVQLDGDHSVLTTFARLLDDFDPDFNIVTP